MVRARNLLRDAFDNILPFTFDGKLVGDLGEALAVQLYGITLLNGNTRGVDGISPDGRLVQIKATSTGRGPAFTYTELHNEAQHLLFLELRLDDCKGEVVYNGPESIVRSYLPSSWANQRALSAPQIRRANSEVHSHQRLLRVDLPDGAVR
ncbi:DUF6998 domain-containing protein [Nitratireductor basaltis]|uniref:DUF6998 domain-containing protein n=1 Tax=Nitratireductor basaltis TaxID=472175 RepID=UPI003CC78273